jgi:hypothetical protein
MCEQRCPIFDTAAIVVYKFGENRRLKGPYMSEAQKQMVTEKRKRTDAISIGPGAGGQSPAEQPTQNDTSTSKEQGAAPSTGFSF